MFKLGNNITGTLETLNMVTLVYGSGNFFINFFYCHHRVAALLLLDINEDIVQISRNVVVQIRRKLPFAILPLPVL